MKISQIILERLNNLEELNEFGFMNAAKSFVRGFQHPNDDYFALPNYTQTHLAYDPTVSGYNRNSTFGNAWNQAKNMFSLGSRNLQNADQNQYNAGHLSQVLNTNQMFSDEIPDFQQRANQGYNLGYNQLGAGTRQVITGAANSINPYIPNQIKSGYNYAKQGMANIIQNTRNFGSNVASKVNQGYNAFSNGVKNNIDDIKQFGRNFSIGMNDPNATSMNMGIRDSFISAKNTLQSAKNRADAQRAQINNFNLSQPSKEQYLGQTRNTYQQNIGRAFGQLKSGFQNRFNSLKTNLSDFGSNIRNRVLSNTNINS